MYAAILRQLNVIKKKQLLNINGQPVQKNLITDTDKEFEPVMVNVCGGAQCTCRSSQPRQTNGNTYKLMYVTKHINLPVRSG